MLSQAEFNAPAEQGYNPIPSLSRCLLDLDTPLSVYLKLANQPYSYFLESVVGGERFGRYSFVGLPAATRLRVSGLRVQVEHGDRGETYEGPAGFIEASFASVLAQPAPRTRSSAP